jgi:hypothetical protein
MKKRRQLVCSSEARPARGQHVRPCGDCPFSREAIPGWLGALTAPEWIAVAHGEAHIECHTRTGAACAGAAIYRANVCKRVRDPKALILPPDAAAVFATPLEFLAHHE